MEKETHVMFMITEEYYQALLLTTPCKKLFQLLSIAVKIFFFGSLLLLLFRFEIGYIISSLVSHLLIMFRR